ncbi:hypothetical protein ACTXMZ_16555 [Brachybacterium alimentarium]|uniref:hypothetical protein n=1 Tax=Brachybacterium alimentarium TaxID=47845 RepID=UPI003FD436A5
MTPRRKYTEEQKAEALRIYKAEGTTAASKQTGIPKPTISSWARRDGMHTVRNQNTAAATEAATVDAAAARATVAGNTIRAADKAASTILERLEAEALTIPLRELATVYGILVDKHVLLARLDDTGDDYSAVDSWINHLMDSAPTRT